MKDETINGYSEAERAELEKLYRLRDLERKASPGEWAADHDHTGSPEETQEYVHLASDGTGHKSLFDTLNSDVRVIEEDHDEESSHYWDSQGRANMKFVAAIRNAAPHLIDEACEAVDLRQRIRELRDALGKIALGYSAPVDLAEYALEADRKAEAGECPF